jgi:hypothetical protein
MKIALLLLLGLGSPQANATPPQEAPSSAEAGSDLTECSVAKPGKPCKMVIDRQSPISGKTFKVENRTPVLVVLIKKSPFESCKNEVKREELPDVSAIPTLLGLITNLAGSLMVPAGAPLKPDEGQQILDSLERVKHEAEAQAKVAETVRARYETVTNELKTFYRTKYLRSQYAGGAIKDEAQFEADRQQVAAAITEVLKLQLPNTVGGEVIYKAVLAHFTAYVRSGKADPNLLPLFQEQINLARSALDVLAKLVAELQTAQAKAQSTGEYLEQLKNPDWEATAALRPDINAKLVGSFTCTSDVSGKPSLDPPVVYTVTFQNTPRLALTAGILVSTVPRNSVGFEAVLDKREDSVVTFHDEIREHPSAPQAIAFSFVNIRLGSPWRWKDRLMTFNLTPGLGLNPNNGATHAEFFLGVALGFENFFLAVGGHAGHKLSPANGFQQGDRPADDLTIPTETPWKPGLGVSLSYRIPLK